jgi:molybdopterin-guanine dinucleotide biosynthesis protein A
VPYPTHLAAVLAGGLGKRMGEPKASLTLGDRPLISYALEAMREPTVEVVVVAKPDTALPELDVGVWREPPLPRHPLCGIVTALREGAQALLVCGCDMPFVTPELAGWLGSFTEPLVVPEAGGLLHPLLGRYGPELLPALERGLEAERPLADVVAELNPRRITEDELRRFGDPERLLFNVNTPSDLATAEGMATSSQARA